MNFDETVSLNKPNQLIDEFNTVFNFKKYCKPQKSLGEECYNDYECVNNMGCLYNKCTLYYSLVNNKTISKLSDEHFCRSGFAFYHNEYKEYKCDHLVRVSDFYCKEGQEKCEYETLFTKQIIYKNCLCKIDSVEEVRYCPSPKTLSKFLKDKSHTTDRYILPEIKNKHFKLTYDKCIKDILLNQSFYLSFKFFVLIILIFIFN